MKRRMGIAAQTHLGGNAKVILDNKWTRSEEYNQKLEAMFRDGLEHYFKEYNGVDFGITHEGIKFGYEPSYQFDPLKIVFIGKEKDNSYLETGRAIEAWASRTISTKRYYRDYKNNCKFTRFVDKWHKELYD